VQGRRRAMNISELVKKDGSLTDEQFERLKEDLEIKSRELEVLKKMYLRQTGRHYVRPVRVARVDKDH
jgi:hypothetical protein